MKLFGVVLIGALLVLPLGSNRKSNDVESLAGVQRGVQSRPVTIIKKTEFGYLVKDQSRDELVQVNSDLGATVGAEGMATFSVTGDGAHMIRFAEANTEIGVLGEVESTTEINGVIYAQIRGELYPFQGMVDLSDVVGKVAYGDRIQGVVEVK